MKLVTRSGGYSKVPADKKQRYSLVPADKKQKIRSDFEISSSCFDALDGN
jgi:hypothetical protein